jgi:hypothetical protein
MISTQRLIRDLALAHGVDAETIVRAAVADFALGRSKGQQTDAIRVARTVTRRVMTKKVTRRRKR